MLASLRVGLPRAGVTSGQHHGHQPLATVRRVGIPPGQSPLGDEAAGPAENADRAASAEWPASALGDLPLRPVSYRFSVPRIRCMDDPEILERVLAGLLNLT